MRRIALCSVLLAAMVGCGDDDAAKLFDGGLDDAAPDSAEPPVTGTVNIVATARGYSDAAQLTPVEGVVAVALRSDGTVAATATTNAEGTATLANVTDGVSVTAVYPEENSERALVTYAAVKVGDTLRFGDNYRSGLRYTAPAIGSAFVSWSLVMGASTYYVYSPCSPDGAYAYQQASVNITIYANCSAASAPVVVHALDADGRLVAAIVVPSAPHIPDSLLTLTADQWVTATANNFTVGLTGLDTATSAYFTLQPGQLGYRFYVPGEYADVESNAATRDFTVSPADLNADAVSSASLYREGNWGAQYSYKRGTSPVALPAPTLPWIGGLIVNAQQALWLQTAGSQYDAAVLQLGWEVLRGSQGSGSGSGGSYIDYTWTFILPPGLSSVAFPAVPAQFADYVPTESTDIESQLTFLDLSSTASYDAVRALAEYRLTNWSGAVLSGDEASLTSATSDGGNAKKQATTISAAIANATSNVVRNAPPLRKLHRWERSSRRAPEAR